MNHASDRAQPQPTTTLTRRVYSRLPQALALLILIGISLIYCWEALRAPFFGGDDTLSNLLPIIHYRDSVLNHHEFPLYTTLWYGGRLQWMNPLWSFAYLPATLIWLLFPLEWGVRLVVFGHLSAALLSGYLLATIWFKDQWSRAAIAILLAAPVLSAVSLGHFEKILAWPWVLLGLWGLLNPRLSAVRRGLWAGLSLGIIALTGANYFVLYAAIIYFPLALTISRRATLGLLAASALGLLHLPNVWFLIGQSRGDMAASLPVFTASPLQIGQLLFIGTTTPPYLMLEGFSVIGVALLIATVVFVIPAYFDQRLTLTTRRTLVALGISGLVLLLLASGVLYQGHHLLDTFRVPIRGLPFAAVCWIVSVSVAMQTRTSRTSRWLRSGLLGLAVLQIGLLGWFLRPLGLPAGLESSGAEALAETLVQRGAHSVWLNVRPQNEMLISVALNQRGISLPNVYYGEMNQTVPISGEFCGYAFDYLLRKQSDDQAEPMIELWTDLVPSRNVGAIPRAALQYAGVFSATGSVWNLYQVSCKPSAERP